PTGSADVWAISGAGAGPVSIWFSPGAGPIFTRPVLARPIFARRPIRSIARGPICPAGRQPVRSLSAATAEPVFWRQSRNRGWSGPDFGCHRGGADVLGGHDGTVVSRADHHLGRSRSRRYRYDFSAIATLRHWRAHHHGSGVDRHNRAMHGTLLRLKVARSLNLQSSF